MRSQSKSPANRVEILIGDAIPLFREGVKSVLERSGPSPRLEEAGSGREFLDKLVANPWHLGILELAIAEPGGLEVLAQARLLRREIPILVVTMLPERRFAVRALRNGAAGYIEKPSCTPDTLLSAVRRTIGGGKFITPSVAEHLAHELEGGEKLPHERLSDREFEIFRLLARGHTLTEIATVLYLSIKTVSTYRTRIMKKVGLRTNVEASRYAAEHALLDPSS